MTTPIMKYNPAFLSNECLVQNFVVRQAELELITQVAAENTGQSNQHVLVIGPRGIGKTMLVLRTAEEIRRRDDLNERWYPLVFSEESYRVTTAGEFWHEAIFHLAQQTDDERWKIAYQELQSEKDDARLRERALAQLMDFADAEHKRLLLVVENLNMLLGEQMSDDEGWTLRHTLLHEPRVMLLATATSRFEQIDNSGKPMFELFRTIELEPLNEDECRKMWISISGQEPKDRRIRPIQILTGGNPRLVAIISSFGARMSFKELMGDLIQLVDDHTEYFKSHLDNLPPIERKVYLSLVELWDPSPARKVAEGARLDVNKTSSLLRRLRERGAVVEVDGKGRTKSYQVAERLYNIYYLMRRHGAPSQRVRAVVNFMVAFYAEEELLNVIGHIATEACKLRPEERTDHYFAYEQILQCNAIDRLREEIVRLAPPGFLDAADAPTSLRSLVAADNDLDLVRPDDLPQETGPDIEDGKAMFERAFTFACHREYGKAIQVFDEIYQRHKGVDYVAMKMLVHRALSNKARLQRKLNKPSEAESTENQIRRLAQEIRTDLTGIMKAIDMLRKSIAFARQREHKEAIVQCDEALSLFADAKERLLLNCLANVSTLKALALCIGEEYTQAIDCCDEAIRRFGDSSDSDTRKVVAGAFEYKGFALSGRGDHAEAIEAYRKSLEFDSSNCTAAVALANLHQRRGRIDEALEQTKKCFALKKWTEADIGIATELLICLAARGKSEEILRQLQKSPSISSLEPLVTGLRLYSGEDVKAAAEIMEVAKDIVKRIDERRLELASADADREQARDTTDKT